MKTHLSHTLRNAMLRMLDASPFGMGRRGAASSRPAPDNVVRRLENVFEALSELSLQPHVAAAFDLACDTLQAELPTEAVAAGLYDIDSDEIRIVAARGAEQSALRGSAFPRASCLVGYASMEPTITSGNAHGAHWLGSGGQDSTVLLCPILHDAHLLGVLALAEPLRVERFEDHDRGLVSYVADQLASFIQTHRHRPPTCAL
ncbi:MAG TPA: GAF domain-containing protein [Polyangiales bacterium]|nr:GAF domain-containing protein [Polyangiales bacterium]